FSSRRRNTRWPRDWSSDVCSSDLMLAGTPGAETAYGLLTMGLSSALGVNETLSAGPLIEGVDVSAFGLAYGTDRSGTTDGAMFEIGRASCRERGEVTVDE